MKDALTQRINKNFRVDIIIIIGLFILNLLIQFHSIGKIVYVFTDEGVYLYASKLITHGYIPFKDFFLAQSPFLIYLNAIVLVIIKFNINIFHYIYTFWFFSAIFPIYFIVLKETKSRWGACIAVILFSTFTEMVQWDAHFFALRQASLPFLAWGIYFLRNKGRDFLSGLLLGFFSLSVLSNFVISFFVLLADIVLNFFQGKKLKYYLRKRKVLLLSFSICVIVGLLMIFLIPSAYDNLVNFQISRPTVSLYYRVQWFLSDFIKNGPILALGLLSTFLLFKKYIFYSIISIGTIMVCFVGSSFYPHYITIWGVIMSISGGLLISYIFKLKIIFGYIALVLIMISIYFGPLKILNDNLIKIQTPSFFASVSELKKVPEPIFSFEPIYAMYANKNLTFYRDVSDMRHLKVLGTNLSEEEYENIISLSKSVILENSALSMIPLSQIENIKNNFIVVYIGQNESIYVKK